MQWVVRKTDCDGIGNVMKGFISAKSVNPMTTIECNPFYSLGRYDTVLDPKHIYAGGPRMDVYTCRFLVLRSEESEQTTIDNEFQYTNGCGNPALNHYFSDHVLIDWNYDVSRIAPRVKDRILRTISEIEFQPHILTQVASYTSRFRPGRVLGISVRTWTAPHEHNIQRPYDFSTYMDAIRPHLSQSSTVVLSVDNEDVLPNYIDALQHDNVIVLRRTDDENETQHAFVKMIVLSKCDVFVGNRISTFSELVFWFGGCKANVVTLF